MKKILGLDLGTNSIGWALVENDFKNNEITSTQVLEWMSLFCDEFAKIGLKLIS